VRRDGGSGAEDQVAVGRDPDGVGAEIGLPRGIAREGIDGAKDGALGEIERELRFRAVEGSFGDDRLRGYVEPV
jgi:hypothetical protein